MSKLDVLNLLLINRLENRFVDDVVHVAEVYFQLQTLLILQIFVHVEEVVVHLLALRNIADQLPLRLFVVSLVFLFALSVVALHSYRSEEVYRVRCRVIQLEF